MAFDQMEKNSKLIIHMASLSNMDVLNKIKEILEANKGGAQVFLSVGAGQGSKKIKTQSQVRVSNELLSSLRKLAEIQKVDVE